MINVHYFNPQSGIGVNNFGDMLVPHIIKYISGEDVEYVPALTEGKVLCIGSEIANGRALQKNDIVWGYGANRKKEVILPDGVKLLATRGHFSAKLIKNGTPEAYGDPALLMPYIYRPKTLKQYDVGIIAHYIDKKLIKTKDPNVLIININNDPFEIIDKLNSCNTIISTSLHGCIVSEAYGIPVTWLKVSQRVIGMEFKWNDYFSATGRDTQEPITMIGELTSIKGLTNKTLPNPRIRTQGLIKAWCDYYDKNK